MGLRPSVSLRQVKGPANCRTAKRKMKKAFVRGVPNARTKVYVTGKRAHYDYKVTLVSKDHMQLRSNQLEASRISTNQYLVKKTGVDGYYMKLYAYPHHVLREHALATGAGADRFSSGMAKAFGKPSGRAARVRPGSKIMAVWVNKEHLKIVKEAFRRGKIKLSAHTKLDVKELK